MSSIALERKAHGILSPVLRELLPFAVLGDVPTPQEAA